MRSSPLSSLDPTLERRPRLMWGIAAVLIMVAALLRFHGLGRESLWVDEIIGVKWTSGSLDLLFDGLSTDRWKPPVYYLIQLPFTHWGAGAEAIVRIPSAIFGVLALPVLFLWMRAAAGPTAGLVALGLLALSPLHVRYSQDASPYSLHVLLTLIASAAVWRLASERISGARWWIIFAISLWAALWTNFLAPIVVVVHIGWVWAVWWSARRTAADSPRAFRVAVGVSAIALTGLISIALRFVALTHAMREWMALEVLPFEPWTLRHLVQNLGAYTFGASPSPSTELIGWIGIPILALGLGNLLRLRPAFAWLLLLLSVANFAGVLLMCALQNHWYAERYPLAGLPPFLMLIAAGIVPLVEGVARGVGWVKRSVPPERAVAALLLAMGVIACPIAAHLVMTRPLLKPGWREVGLWLRDNAEPGSVVLLTDDWDTGRVMHYIERFNVPVTVESHEDPQAFVARATTVEHGFALHHVHQVQEEEWRFLIELTPVPTRLPHLVLLWLSDDPAQWFADHRDAIAGMAEEFRRAGRRLDVGEEPIAGVAGGWWMPEGRQGDTRFRWAATTSPNLILALAEARDETLVFRASTFGWPGAPAQWTEIRVNDRVVGQGEIMGSWSVYAVPVPASVWKIGANVVEFRTDHVGIPAELYDSHDTRTLSIALDWVSLGDEGPIDHDWSGTPPLDADHERLAEAAALFAQRGHRLDVGEEPFPAVDVRSWHPSERWEDGLTVRWSRDRRAAIDIPLQEPADGDLRFRAAAFAWEGTPPQRTVVLVNGTPVGEGILNATWEVHHVPVSGELWRSGLNTVVFETDHVASPAETGGAPDHRPLGMALDWIELVSGEADAAPPDVRWHLRPEEVSPAGGPPEN